MKTVAERTNRRPNGTIPNPVRSVRCSDAMWEQAKARAAEDGVTMSLVLSLIIEGYAQRLLDLPKMSMTYVPPVRESA